MKALWAEVAAAYAEDSLPGASVRGRGSSRGAQQRGRSQTSRASQHEGSAPTRARLRDSRAFQRGGRSLPDAPAFAAQVDPVHPGRRWC